MERIVMGLFNRFRWSRSERSEITQDIIRESLSKCLKVHDILFDNEALSERERIELQKELSKMTKKDLRSAQRTAYIINCFKDNYNYMRKKMEIAKIKEFKKIEMFYEQKLKEFEYDQIRINCEKYDLKYLAPDLKYILTNKKGYILYNEYMNNASIERVRLGVEEITETELETSAEAVVQENVAEDPTGTLVTSVKAEEEQEQDETQDEQPLIAEEMEFEEDIEVEENEEEEDEKKLKLFDKLLNS